MKTITIRLTAPMQSYGVEASYNFRTSTSYPSKSAVIGMIASALGWVKENPRVPELNKLLYAVRIEQPGQKMTDLQLFEWKKDARKLRYKDYIQDAVFMIALGGSSEAIDKIKGALLSPVYPIYLGRKCNPPAGILRIEEYPNNDPVSVLKDLPWQASEWYQDKYGVLKTKIFADASLIKEQEPILVKDKIISLNQENRKYSFRPVASLKVKLTNSKKVTKGESHVSIQN